MFVILMLQHHLRQKIKVSHLIAIVFLLSGFTLGSLTGAIMSFGYEAAKLRFPAYEEWRLVIVEKYITHVDFLSIYIWLSSAYIRISLTFYLMVDLLQIKKASKKIAVTMILGVAMIILMQIPISDTISVNFITASYAVSFFFVSALSVLLLLWVHWKTRKEANPQ
ncbi:GerAB/ArcD/ProY family transporter [Gordoniibacillus kamchatkensis]|uniref:GerAB/ArcD/ProY family transporter n=1 Tax=Gordoniibacillus kamchatkensis TaxID=1590651 RepID=UPI000698979D|nr:GerAB/ArcD/ProY family transporter [Paenibacillus sp. VKM B-2647]